MPNKKFSERLNRELDNLEVPLLINERIAVLAKLINIPKFKAEAFLNGNQLPDIILLDALALELDVNGDWLIGRSELRLREMSD
jgi:hypothetical protein